jgi:ferredoxin
MMFFLGNVLFVWLVGSWERARSQIAKVEDPKFRCIARNACNTIAADVSQVQHELIEKVGSSEKGDSTITYFKESYKENRKESFDEELVPLPMLLRTMDIRAFLDEEVYGIVEDLLWNRSNLIDRTGEPE